MQLINCKFEFKHKWAKYCVLAAAGAYNNNANPKSLLKSEICVPTWVAWVACLRGCVGQFSFWRVSNFLGMGQNVLTCVNYFLVWVKKFLTWVKLYEKQV